MTAAPRPARPSAVKGLLRRPLGLASSIVLAIIAFVAIFGGILAPQDPNRADLHAVLASPSADHLFGADSAGRDVLSRLLTSTQTTIGAALLALVVALVIGVVAGLIAGYYKGWFDATASWVTSLTMAMPAMVILLAARSIVGPSVWAAMAIFGIVISPVYFRLVYATVTTVREELYVDAARVSGLSDMRILGCHVLSAVRAPIIVQSAIVMGMTIAIQAGLEFLGLGDLQVPTWGGQMLNDAFQNIYRVPGLMLVPSLAIAITCIALALFSNALRDELERAAPTKRRKRRKVVQTATGSLSAVTTSFSMTGEAPVDLDELPVVDDSEVIVHEDAVREGTPLVEIDGLRVAYDQPEGEPIEVVHGVTLDVNRSEVHGLIGESGSGKSQTAFALLGLLPRGGHVSAGTITFDGVDVAGEDEAAYAGLRGKRIGYIPQEPMTNLDPSFTIGSQLTEPLRRTMGMSKQQAKARALELLERVGIPDPQRTFDAYPFEVSGGMAQRVLIAGAVSTDPALIVADEPTTALDVTVQAEVLDLLRDLQRERGMAMLLVTHNFGVVADLCDRVTVMQDGRFVEQGPVRSIFHEARHPYTQALLGAILDEGPARAPLSTGGAR